MMSAGIQKNGRIDVVLFDFGGVIVHLFSPMRRAYYRLEQLWSGARVVVRMA